MHTLNLRSFVWFITGVTLTLTSVAIFGAWRVDAEVTPGESTFVPVTPCRLFDTRAEFQVGPRSTPLTQTPYTQSVVGTNGDCTIPVGATAVAMNVTITEPTAPSFLAVFPSDADGIPTASNLNYVAGQAPTPNKVDVKLSATGTIDFFNAAGTVNVLADVVGYYSSSSLEQLASDVAALRAQIDPDDQTVTELADDVAALEAQVTAGAAATSALATDLAALQTQTTAGATDLANLATDVTAVQAEAAAAAIEVAGLTSDLAALQADVAAGTVTTTGLADDLAALQTQVTASAATLTGLGNFVVALQAQIEAGDAATAVLASDLATLQTQVTTSSTALTALTDDLTTLQGRVTAGEATAAALAADIGALETQAAASTAALDGLVTDLATLQAQVTADAATLAALGTDVTDLQADVAAGAATLAALGTDVTDLAGRVTTNEGDITALESDVTAIQLDITNINSDVTALEGDVTGLQADIAAMQSDVGALLADDADIPVGTTVTGQEIALSAELSAGVISEVVTPFRLPGNASADLDATTVKFAGFNADTGVTNDTTTCPGTANNPTALSGNLCIYFVSETNVDTVDFAPTQLDAARFFGIAVSPDPDTPAAGGNPAIEVQAALLVFTWAYTG